MSINRRRLGLGFGGLALFSTVPGARAESWPALRIVTGDLPPFAVEASTEHPGVLVELAEAVLRHAGMAAKAEFYPWARALHLVKQQPRVAILPLTRTPEREAQYQWLLKLYVQHFAFITRSDDAPVTHVARARRMRVALLRGSPNLAQLLRQDFSEARIVQAPSVEDMLKLLERGHVEAIYGGELICLDKARTTGRDLAGLRVGLRLDSGDVWLAGGSGFSDADRQRLEDSHRALLRDGSIERLFRSYGIRPRPEELR